jgi:DNA-binding NarL/FixJ family response regulator
MLSRRPADGIGARREIAAGAAESRRRRMVLVPQDPVRVLIAGRSPAWSAGVASYLPAPPLRVDVAPTVEDALAGIAAGGHDLVLIDRDLARALARSATAAGDLRPFLERARMDEAADALLTGQERVVLGLMRQHLTYKEIAQRLGVSWHTVRTHAQSILRKRGVHSRRDLERVDPWPTGGPHASGAVVAAA